MHLVTIESSPQHSPVSPPPAALVRDVYSIVVRRIEPYTVSIQSTVFMSDERLNSIIARYCESGIKWRSTSASNVNWRPTPVTETGLVQLPSDAQQTAPLTTIQLHQTKGASYVVRGGESEEQ